MDLNYREKVDMHASVSLTFPKISNHKVCDDYLISKCVTRGNKVTTEDNINRNATIEHYFATKNLRNVEERLKARKELAAKQRQDLDEQWEDLRKKEDELRENFIFFNKFIHENSEKRERAQAKLSRMKELLSTRLQQILEKESEYQEMAEIKQCLDERIIGMKLYETFLAEVVKHFPRHFTGIVDILNRYGTLMHAQSELTGILEKGIQQVETSRSHIMKLVEEKNFIIMGLNNQIANLQARFENANINALESEQLVLQIKNSAVKQMSDIDQVKASIWNVYTHMAHSKRHPIKIKKENVEEQMMYIKRTLTELSKVNQILRKRAKTSNTDDTAKA